MKLYVFQVAPNPTKVRLYLSEREVSGARVEVEEISINIPEGEAKTPGFLKKNPQGQLPVLELENEIFITESLPIIEYFEEYDPQYKMFGNTSEARAISRSLERTVDTGVLIPVGMTVHATRSPIGLPPNAEVAAAGLRSARGTLELLNVLMSDGRSYLEGDEPSVADCTLAAALQFGRFGRLSLLDDLDHLAIWDERYRARPAAKNILII